jgi:hypothetical protein
MARFDCTMSLSGVMQRTESSRDGGTLRKAAFAGREPPFFCGEIDALRTHREAQLPATGSTSLREQLRWDTEPTP